MKKDSPLYKYMKERMEQDDKPLKEETRKVQILYALLFIYAISFIVGAAVSALF